MDGREWREFVDTLRARWRALWRDRIDDRVRAEGIAREDYELLFVHQGTVIVATRDYEPPRFRKIVERHAVEQQPGREVAPPPAVGGWGKFIREVIRPQERVTKHGRPVPSERRKARPQVKKGGKGWLHVRMR